jgi:uncharacterized protein YjbI with pentapeptide repeats
MKKVALALLKHNVPVWNRLRKMGYITDLDLRRSDLSHLNLSHIDLSYADLSRSDLSYADLSHADLNHTNLSHAKLRSTNLTHANLSYADLQEATLSVADLSYADLSNAKFIDAKMNSAKLYHANLRTAKLTNAELSYADLSSSDASHAYFGMVDLDESILSHADLSHANLSNAKLTSANLTQTNLQSAYMGGTNLTNAILNGANLTHANLSSAKIIGASLLSANITHTDLSRADLSNANLAEAIFTSADLSHADLNQCVMTSTYLNDIDLRVVDGLDSIIHKEPSFLGIDTLYRSQGQISEPFLNGCRPSEEIQAILHAIQQALQPHTASFIYSHEDKLFVEHLSQDLRNNGIDSWHNPGLPEAEERLNKIIDQAIKASEVIILILSGHAIQNEDFAQEVKLALKQDAVIRRNDPRKIGLFPVRIDDETETTDIFWVNHLYQTREIYDFTQWQDNTSYQKAITHLVYQMSQPSIGKSGTR